MQESPFISVTVSDTRCEVCGDPVGRAQLLKTRQLDYVVCTAYACNRVMLQRDSMAPAMFRAHLKFQREMLHKHRERQAEHTRRVAEMVQRQRGEHRHALERFLTANSQPEAKVVQTVVIPSGRSKVDAVTAQRVEEYLQHLREIIAQAMTWRSEADVIHDEHVAAQTRLASIESRFAARPALRQSSDSLCGLCKGGCCVSGGNHAYLSTFTMYRQIQQHPDWSEMEFIDVYRSRLGEFSMRDSCINHTPHGCALPRELRSDICNAFYCDALKNYQDSYERNGPGPVLVIQRSSPYSSISDPDRENAIEQLYYLDGDSEREVDRYSGLLN